MESSSQTLDIDALLADAEVLYLTFRKVLDASDRRWAEEAEKRGITAVSSSGGLRRRNGKERERDEGEKEEQEAVAEVVVDGPPEIDETLRVLVG